MYISIHWSMLVPMQVSILEKSFIYFSRYHDSNQSPTVIEGFLSRVCYLRQHQNEQSCLEPQHVGAIILCGFFCTGDALRARGVLLRYRSSVRKTGLTTFTYNLLIKVLHFLALLMTDCQLPISSSGAWVVFSDIHLAAGLT